MINIFTTKRARLTVIISSALIVLLAVFLIYKFKISADSSMSGSSVVFGELITTDGYPVVGRVSVGEHTTKTNDDGSFQIFDLPYGNYTIFIYDNEENRYNKINQEILTVNIDSPFIKLNLDNLYKT